MREVQMITKGRKLKDMEINEISFVNKPANKKRFVFIKRQEEITIMSEKKITEDVDFVAILKALSDEGDDSDTTLVQEYNEFMDVEMEIAVIEKAEKLPAPVLTAIRGAFRMLNKYKDQMPSELKAAISALAKLATGKGPYPEPYKKGDEKSEELEKAGARVSKATALKIAEAVEKLLSVDPANIEKAREAMAKPDEKKMVQKIFDKLFPEEEDDPPRKEEVRKEEKKEEKDDSSVDEKESEAIGKVLERLDDLGSRLTGIEKSGAEKKTVESDGTKDKLKKSNDEDDWPSFDLS